MTEWTPEAVRGRPWRSGPWTARIRGADLADLRRRGRLVLRAVQAVVRDPDWRTLPVVLTGVDERAGRLRLELRFDDPDSGEPALHGTLAAHESTGALRVEVRLRAVRDLRVNRAGLIVLHPPTLAGAPLAVTHVDGRVEHTRFPRGLAPHQPAVDVAGLAWPVPGGDVALQFSGDVFEMEDQRNWTDASFKTYSTPLARPFPVDLAAGTTIEHAVEVRVDAEPDRTPTPDRVRLDLAPTGAAHPAVVLGATTAPGPPRPASSSAEALLVEVDAGAANAAGVLSRAAEEAAGHPLDARIVAEQPEEVARALDLLEAIDARLLRVGAFSHRTHVTEPALWTALRDGATGRPRLARATLVGGTRAHFTELNRGRDRLPGDLPALTFSVTPQMHATDAAQLVESIAMQRLVAEAAVGIAGDRPVHVGPVTLRARFNAVATTPAPEEPDDAALGHGADGVPGSTDPRQASPTLEAWTIASAAALAVPGVASVARFEASGPRGVADADGRPLPASAALDVLRRMSGHPVWSHPAGADQRVWALAAEIDGTVEAVVANLLAEPVAVELSAGARSAHLVVPALSTAAWTAPDPAPGAASG